MPKFKSGGGVAFHDSDVDFHTHTIDLNNFMCNVFVVSPSRVMNIVSLSRNNTILSPHRSMEI